MGSTAFSREFFPPHTKGISSLLCFLTRNDSLSCQRSARRKQGGEIILKKLSFHLWFCLIFVSLFFVGKRIKYPTMGYVLRHKEEVQWHGVDADESCCSYSFYPKTLYTNVVASLTIANVFCCLCFVIRIKNLSKLLSDEAPDVSDENERTTIRRTNEQRCLPYLLFHIIPLLIDSYTDSFIHSFIHSLINHNT